MMKQEFQKNKDFWAGLMFVGIGLFIAVQAVRNYSLGDGFRIGPGFFPVLTGGCLVALGAIVLVRGLLNNDKIKGRMSLNAWRAVIVPLVAMVLFGLLMTHMGLIPALAVLGIGGAAASTEFKFSEALLMTAALTGFSVALFVWALGLYIPLFIF